MVKLAKLIVISAFLFCFTKETEAKEKAKKEGIISEMSAESLEKMRLDQSLENLTNKTYQIFETTVYYFVKLGPRAINPLVRHLKDNSDDTDIIIAVIYTLGRIGPNASRAVSAIIPYLTHENRDVVVTGVSALGKIGKASNKSVSFLQQMLFDRTDVLLSDLSLRSLKDINTPSALAIVREYENLMILEKQREKNN